MPEPSLDIESFYLLNSPDTSSPGNLIKDTHVMFSVPAFIGEEVFSEQWLSSAFEAVLGRDPIDLQFQGHRLGNLLGGGYYLLSKDLLDGDSTWLIQSQLPPAEHVLIRMLQEYTEGKALSPYPVIRARGLFIHVTSSRIVISPKNLFSGVPSKTYSYFPLYDGAK